MERILELKFEVLVDANENIYKVLDNAFYALWRVPEIREVDTSDVEDLGIFEESVEPINV